MSYMNIGKLVLKELPDASKLVVEACEGISAAARAAYTPELARSVSMAYKVNDVQAAGLGFLRTRNILIENPFKLKVHWCGRDIQKVEDIYKVPTSFGGTRFSFEARPGVHMTEVTNDIAHFLPGGMPKTELVQRLPYWMNNEFGKSGHLTSESGRNFFSFLNREEIDALSRGDLFALSKTAQKTALVDGKNALPEDIILSSKFGKTVTISAKKGDLGSALRDDNAMFDITEQRLKGRVELNLETLGLKTDRRIDADSLEHVLHNRLSVKDYAIKGLLEEQNASAQQMASLKQQLTGIERRLYSPVDMTSLQLQPISR